MEHNSSPLSCLLQLQRSPDHSQITNSKMTFYLTTTNSLLQKLKNEMLMQQFNHKKLEIYTHLIHFLGGNSSCSSVLLNLSRSCQRIRKKGTWDHWNHAIPPSETALLEGSAPGTAIPTGINESAGWSHFLFFLNKNHNTQKSNPERHEKNKNCLAFHHMSTHQQILIQLLAT